MQVPVLGVLFSAPLVCMDPSGQVRSTTRRRALRMSIDDRYDHP